MTENVLVVHGVANRDEAAFVKLVSEFGDRINARGGGTRYNIVPAYWGDLAGGNGENLHYALPPSITSDALGVRSEADADVLVEHIYRTRRNETYVVRSEDEITRMITDAASDAMSKGAGGYETRSGGVDATELRDAIEEAVRNSTYVKRLRDPTTAHAIGEAVGASLAGGGEEGFETRGRILTGLRDAVARVVGAIDTVLGSITSEALGALNQAVRGALAEATARSFGDIVAYRDTDNGAAIRNRVLERARAGGIDPSKPIIVVAHSLGGLVVVDMLLKGDLRARRLVTCGSQPAMFHVLKQLPSLVPYAPGKSSPVSANIASWTNLWHPMDVLAFVASPVFALHDGRAPTDIRIDTPLSTILADKLWMHSAYWKGDELVEAVVG